MPLILTHIIIVLILKGNIMETLIIDFLLNLAQQGEYSQAELENYASWLNTCTLRDLVNEVVNKGHKLQLCVNGSPKCI